MVSAAGKTQLRIAETEKYPHVTYFFNGGVEPPYPGEDRRIVPSPKVATYDLQPEMSAAGVTEEILRDLPNYDLVILNFANPDMVGHTGVTEAAVRAVETIDDCVRQVVERTLETGRQGADHRRPRQLRNTHAIRTAPLTPRTRPTWCISSTRRRTPPATAWRMASWRTWPRRCWPCSGLPRPMEMTGQNLVVGIDAGKVVT